MTLKNARAGAVYKIYSMKLDHVIRRRLEALGLTRGTDIKVLNRNCEGAAIVMVRGSRLALGSKITEEIYMGEAFK